PERSLRQTIQSEQVRTLTTWSHVIPDSAGIFYTPVNEHFRAQYEIDQINCSRQRWERYWGWVQSFYHGNILARGWTNTCGRIVDDLPGGYPGDDLIGRMNVLGRLIAAEWAKNNAVRSITTHDLQQWGALMRKAIRGRDTDDPTPVLNAFRQIELEVHVLGNG
ncbi:hypothetical protein ACFL3H_10195, partial [Gemmatimonadota bacterium]